MWLFLKGYLNANQLNVTSDYCKYELYRHTMQWKRGTDNVTQQTDETSFEKTLNATFGAGRQLLLQI